MKSILDIKIHNTQNKHWISSFVPSVNYVLNPLKQLFQNAWISKHHWKQIAIINKKFKIWVQPSFFFAIPNIRKPNIIRKNTHNKYIVRAISK